MRFLVFAFAITVAAISNLSAQVSVGNGNRIGGDKIDGNKYTIQPQAGEPLPGEPSVRSLPLDVTGNVGARETVKYIFTHSGGCVSAYISDNPKGLAFGFGTSAGDSLAEKSARSFFRSGRRLDQRLPPGIYSAYVSTRKPNVFRLQISAGRNC